MIKEYINFVQELFPCISPGTKESVREALSQFKVQGKTFCCLQSTPFKDLVQGDIVGPIPFRRYHSNGQEFTVNTRGMVLSNSCDVENDETILIAPFIPIAELTGYFDRASIENNRTYRLFYLPDPEIKSDVVDLSLISTFPKKLIHELILHGKIEKIGSLNQLGYYMFLCKLTIHLMRPEDTELNGLRQCC